MMRREDSRGFRRRLPSLIVVLVATGVFVGAAVAAKGPPPPAPPDPPSHLRLDSAAETTVTLRWERPRDNSAASYAIYLDQVRVATTPALSFTFTNLSCGHHYSLGVASVGKTGLLSRQRHREAHTDRCHVKDTTPPVVSISAPSAGAVVRQGVTVTANASDAGSGLAGVAFRYCPGASCSFDHGIAIGSDASAPWSFVWSSQPADGTYAIVARATDVAGNTADSSSIELGIDNTAPDTAISGGPTTPTNAVTASLMFGSEADASFECSLDGGAFASCSSPKSYSALTEGSHTFRVRAVDAAGNVDPSPASETWLVDLAPPSTSITCNGATCDSTFAGPVSVTLTATDAAGSGVAQTRFTTDGTDPTLTTGTPYLAPFLLLTSTTVRYRSFDAAGNAEPIRSQAVAIDTTPPDTAITSGPSGTVSTASATFSFTSEPGATFACSLDGGAFATCTSPIGYSGLADGAHSFAVRATDAAGNVDMSPATAAWRIDTTAPETRIDSHPGADSAQAAVTFDFSSEAGATFACALDGAAYAACTSPQSYSGLSDGSHSFEVRAVDEAGNTDATPASFSWRVDTTPPETTIADAPGALTNATSAAFSFTSESDATFGCSLDGAAYTSCTSPASYIGLTDGAHSFSVRAADALGNVDPTPAVASWTIDTTPPTVKITAAPSGLTSAATAEFDFTSEAGATFRCTLDGGTGAACVSPVRYSTLPDGSHTFTVAGTDAAGNTSDASSRTWTVDTTAPDTSIDTAPASLVRDRTATFLFSSETGATFECSIDGGVFAACASPASYGSLADGGHTFRVHAIDPAGNIDPTPALATWTIDTTPPDTTIASGPSGVTSSTGASFAFASEGGASLECSLDAAAFSGCTSPAGYSGLADGSHTFEVRATDAAGNVGDPASRTWTVDTVPPAVTITAGPADPTNGPSPSFSFTTEAGAVATCSIDGSSFAACDSPRDYAALPDGSHTFTVRATDTAGNSASATRTWTVDTTPPAIAITTGPTDPTNDTSPSFTFTGDPGSVTECALDGGVFATCTSPKSYDGLGDGDHTFVLRATDPAGNVATANQGWTIDTTAPDVAITGGPSGLTDSASASFTFTSEPGAAVVCGIDDAPLAPCTSPQAYAGLAEGSHTFHLRATDAAGNSASSARTWTIDTTAPIVTIAAGPSGTTNVSSAIFSFTTEQGATTQCALDENAFAACASPVSYDAIADGAHSFRVRATDAAGNSGNAARAWTIDTTAPAVEITAGPSGATNDASPSFSFASDSDAVTECALDGAAFAGCSAPKSYTNLADGDHSFSVRATDSAGNAATATRTWTIDTAPPVVTITGGPNGAVGTASASFAFTTEADAVTTCSLDDAAFAACSSPQEYSNLADGSHTFRIRAADRAGNIGSASRAWTIDVTAPVVTITSGPSATTSSASASFSFTTESGATLECSLDGAPPASCSSPKSYTNLADGDHSFSVRATDSAGNAATATRTWTIDTVGPTVTIASGPSGTTSSSSASFAFSTEAGAATACSLDAASFATCSSPQSYTALADGPHSFTVRASDAAGNAGSATRSWTIDTTAPDTRLDSTPDNPSTLAAASFSFSSPDAAATFECSLDAATFATCTSPKSYTGLADGGHTFAVRAVDAAGNADATPASFTWTIDASPPDTTISGAPAAFTKATSATLILGSDDGSSSFRCALDTTTFTACASPVALTGLGEGLHTFQAKAVDSAGNADPTPVSVSWTIDTVAPAVALTAPAAGTVSGTVSLVAAASDSGGIESVQFTLDGAPIGAARMTSPYELDWDATAATPGGHTLGAVATDRAGNSTTSASVAVTVTGSNPSLSPGLVSVGPGYVDPTMHQVVRTAGDRVYIAAVDDSAYADPHNRTGPAVVRMYRANTTGTPTSFAEADTANHPRPGASGAIDIGGADARIDSHGLIHVVFLEDNFRTPLNYQTFDTSTDRWTVTNEEIATGLPKTERGFDAFAMALDGSDVPHVVYVSGGALFYTSRTGGVWAAAQQIATGVAPTHPTLTFDTAGNLYLAWLDDAAGAPTVRYARRAVDGSWSAAETVAASDVLSDVTADQGPSIAVTTDGTVYVCYVSASRGTFAPSGSQFGIAQVKYRTTSGWVDDSPTSADDPPNVGLHAHDPQIAAHGKDVYVFLGHDTAIRIGYAYQQQGHGWSTYTPLSATSDGTLDGAASIRQSTFADPNPNVIDGAFFDEDKLDNETWQPQLYYHAVTPAAPPAVDATPPTVSISAPADGSTVSGTVSLQANAADDVGVASVQFKVDGSNVGSPDTSSPYSVNWDTSGLTSGSAHLITAVATDAAGNTTTATATTVTIGTAPAPTTLFGDATVFTHADNDPAGLAEAFRITASAAGAFSVFHIYLTAPLPSTVTVGIYADNGGVAGALLGQATVSSPVSGWNTASLAQSVALTGGTQYWVALLSPLGAGTVNFVDGSGLGGRAFNSSSSSLTALPGAWANGGGPWSDGPPAIYGTTS